MSKNINACFSHLTDDWKTPKRIYDRFINNGFIDCAPYMSEEDYLLKDFHKQKLFINPPFSKLKDFAKWIVKQVGYDNEIILLLPARTDTKYFHELLKLNPIIYFIKGRLRFNDCGKCAPFPTLLMYFNKLGLLPLWSVYYE